jgi:hypothetical protein
MTYRVSDMFGSMSFFAYFYWMTITSAGLFLLTPLFAVLKLRKTWLVLACASGILLLHSLISHKEYRFVLGSIPLLLIATAIVISETKTWRRGAVVFWSGSTLVLIVSIAGLVHQLPKQKIVYRTPVYSTPEILQAYKLLYREDDLAAVWNTVFRNPFDTGGYYYLHRNVPIYLGTFLPDTLERSNIKEFVSHIICLAGADEIPGFKRLVRFENLEIRKNVDPPNEYRRLAFSTDVLIPGIDDRYHPQVKPLF